MDAGVDRWGLLMRASSSLLVLHWGPRERGGSRARALAGKHQLLLLPPSTSTVDPQGHGARAPGPETGRSIASQVELFAVMDSAPQTGRDWGGDGGDRRAEEKERAPQTNHPSNCRTPPAPQAAPSERCAWTKT